MKKVILSVVLLLTLCFNCVAMYGCSGAQRFADFKVPDEGIIDLSEN